MKLKRAGFFALAVLISCLLAVNRWGDSGHAIGLISLNGGMYRHPVVMKGGKKQYSQITTVTVLPPFKGAARISIEGEPQLDYEIFLAKPVIDLGFSRIPELRENTLYNLKAGDRLAIWTLIRPACSDGIGKAKFGPAGLAGSFHEIFPYLKNYSNGGNSRHQTCSSDSSVHGNYSLAFYDAATGRPILNVPLVFMAQGEENGRFQH